MRGRDHTGITVPDMAPAVAFFTDIVACRKAMSLRRSAGDTGADAVPWRTEDPARGS